MTMGELIESPGLALIVVISGTGACIACHNWGSRLWFFLMAPVVYAILWFVVGAAMLLPLLLLEIFTGMTASGELHGLLATAVTMVMYGLNCIMFRRDGVRGLRMKEPIVRRGKFRTPASTDLPATASQMTLSWDNGRRPNDHI